MYEQEVQSIQEESGGKNMGRNKKVSEYLTFVKLDYLHGKRLKGKTDTIGVFTKSGCNLGIIKWCSPWRQYVFYPTESTLFSSGCLQEISNFISALMAER
jgi:hypothetical protein